MRVDVRKNTFEKLIVRLRPTGTWALVSFGFLMVLAGPFIVWLLGHATEVRVSDGQLMIRRAFLGQYLAKETQFPVIEIEEVGTRVFESGISRTLDVVVTAHAGEFRIPFASLDGDEKVAMAMELQGIVDSVDGKFEFSSGTDLVWGAFLLALCLLAGGVYCLAHLQSSMVFADRSKDRICVKSGRWLWPFKQTHCIKLSNFRQILEHEFAVGVPHGPTATSFRVELQTRQGLVLSLAHGAMFTKHSMREIRQLLEAWITPVS